MDYRYFRNKAPLHKFIASEMELSEAERSHEEGRPYTVGIFSGDTVQWSLHLGPGATGGSTQFFDELCRKTYSYGWTNRASGDEHSKNILTLSQAFGLHYHDNSSEWSKKTSIYFKDDGRLWRRYFSKESGKSEDVVEEGGAEKYAITLPRPNFGSYEAFQNQEIAPVFSWLKNWPTSDVT